MPSYANRTFYIGEEQPDADIEPKRVHSSVSDGGGVDHMPDDRPFTNTRMDGWLSGILSLQCGCGNTVTVRALGLLTLLLLCWCLLVVLVGGEALPGGGLFKLLSLVLVAQLVGELVEFAGLPSILGMLLTGILFRSVDLYDAEGVYEKIVTTLREMSLGVILIKAGLGLDPVALKRLSFTVIRLAVCPGLMEAVTVALLTHYFLGYPWLWGFALGFLLCAISPAVVVPTLLKLKKEGYGEGKGISTLVIAASSIDDVLAITVFSVCLSVIFTTGESLVSQILQGPKDVLAGLAVGTALGVLAALTPHLEDDFLVVKRAMVVGVSGLCALLGGPIVGFPGAGSLVCIATPFIANILWTSQGWNNDPSPVEEVFSVVWTVMEPVLFGLIGAEIDLRQLQLETLTWGVLIIAAALLIRVLTCSLVLVGGKLNFKEVVFVNLAWLPKATVQAALAPQALDMARKMTGQHAAELQRGEEFLTIAVLSILITAPLGSVGAALAGPCLLAKAHTSDPDNTRQDSHL